MNKILLSFIFSALIFASCCNELPVTIPEFELPKTEKVVLVEEFTGVSCINCPDAAVALKNIEKIYEGQVISIAIHAGNQSEPLKKSKYDLRCEDGIKLESNWSYDGKPAAAIDRVIYEAPNIPVSSHISWQSYIEEEFKKDNVLNIELSINYNTETRDLKIKVKMIPVIDLPGNFKLNVVLAESHIIDAQMLRNGTIKEDYEFNNVLRDMITPWNGQYIGEDLKKNDLILKSFSYTLPEDENLWKAENIKVVAYVTGGEESDLRPVINATESKIIE